MVKKTTFLKTFSIYSSVIFCEFDFIEPDFRALQAFECITSRYIFHIKNISIFFCFSSNLWPLENFNRLIAKMLCKMKKKGGENCLSSLSSLFTSKLHHFVFVRLNANHFVCVEYFHSK